MTHDTRAVAILSSWVIFLQSWSMHLMDILLSRLQASSWFSWSTQSDDKTWEGWLRRYWRYGPNHHALLVLCGMCGKAKYNREHLKIRRGEQTTWCLKIVGSPLLAYFFGATMLYLYAKSTFRVSNCGATSSQMVQLRSWTKNTESTEIIWFGFNWESIGEMIKQSWEYS